MQHITSSGDPETARQVLSRVRELSDEICVGITGDYDKLRAISQWVSRNMYYDKDASEKGVTEDMLTLEHVLEYHRSVCFGWSNLFSALCQAQGIWRCYRKPLLHADLHRRRTVAFLEYGGNRRQADMGRYRVELLKQLPQTALC